MSFVRAKSEQALQAAGHHLWHGPSWMSRLAGAMPHEAPAEGSVKMKKARGGVSQGQWRAAVQGLVGRGARGRRQIQGAQASKALAGGRLRGARGPGARSSCVQARAHCCLRHGPLVARTR